MHGVQILSSSSQDPFSPSTLALILSGLLPGGPNAPFPKAKKSTLKAYWGRDAGNSRSSRFQWTLGMGCCGSEQLQGRVPRSSL